VRLVKNKKRKKASERKREKEGGRKNENGKVDRISYVSVASPATLPS